MEWSASRTLHRLWETVLLDYHFTKSGISICEIKKNPTDTKSGMHLTNMYFKMDISEAWIILYWYNIINKYFSNSLPSLDLKF